MVFFVCVAGWGFGVNSVVYFGSLFLYISLVCGLPCVSVVCCLLLAGGFAVLGYWYGF